MKVVKRFAAIALVIMVIVGVLGLSACGTKQEGTTGEIKAALIMPGVHTDFGWNYVGFTALANLKAKMPEVKKIDYTELVEPGAAEKTIRDYIAGGYNLIFVLGYQYKEGVDRVVAEKPANVHIAVCEGSDKDLIAGLVSYYEPKGNTASYILGVLAAGMSKTGKVGVISGMESVDVNRDLAGFKPGVEGYDNGKQQVTNSVVGRWDDPAQGKTVAEGMINAGVDVIYCMGDGTSLGVMQAVQEARAANKDIYYIGYPSDQHAAFNDVVLTSIVYDWNDAYLNLAKDVLNGSFGKQGYSISIDKGVTIAPFYQFEDAVPAALKAKMDDVKAKIIKGDLKVPET